jgi:rhodanese-related sulfurtransferase
MADRLTLENLTPAELAKGLGEGRYLLVDVREPAEFDAGHIEGAVPFPLSTFDPAALPDPDGKAIVFQCAGGVRSARAAEAAMAAGVPANRHLAGGINAWKSAGLPTVS